MDGCPETQLDGDTEPPTEPEDSLYEELTRGPSDDLAKMIAESTQLKPNNVVDPRDGFAKKIAEATQLNPRDVKAVFAAMRSTAYADLKKTMKFVIPGMVQLRLRRVRRERHGRVVLFGNFRLEA
jgi:nucleoid DNA-binding protein